MNKFRVYGVTCVLTMVAMLLATTAGATTIVLPTDEQLIAKSPVIVDGSVVSTQVMDRDGALWTDSVIQVSRTLKGEVADTITIREMGGILGDRITKLYGSPEFTKGENVLLFLEPNPRGGYRVMDLYVGKFTRGAVQSGRPLWVRDDVTSEVALLDADLQPLHAKNIQRDANGFETFIHERVAGRVGVRNYGVENPVLVREATPARNGISSEFTLLSESSIYRWFRFANGQAAAWYSTGSQPGYADGGVSELRTAMAAWTGYTSANINYTYAGTRTGAMGGLDSPNGVNEVLFGDPLDEIAGGYNRSTGGVVGRGGFNGVSSRMNFTTTFTADADHPAGTLLAWNITEGNLTIQDGVSPTNGIPSRMLAEIVSHEFGHTLGFGHSADGSALMYATVTGLGPALRADDQAAARWLYPNGSTPTNPPPAAPAAPSALTAQTSSNNIDLRWTDNSANELGFSIYLSANNGAFSKATDVAANATSARLSGLASGSYRVYVVAFNATGNSAQSNTATATIGSAPVAKITVTPQTGVAGVTSFTFYDESTGSVSSRQWSFGDGATSMALVTTHVYATSGQFTVTLTVSGNGTSSSASTVITVSPSAPVTPTVKASFNTSTQSPQIGEAVTFTDTSTGSPTSWTWSFGDGATSKERNPSHVYLTPGTYFVSLTAFNPTGASIANKQIEVSSIVPYRALVSVATYGGGVGGTAWRTELNLFNAGSQGANVSLVFLPTAGGNVITKTLFLSPKQLKTYANALVDLFGISSGAGALGIEATSAGASADLRVSSRTFTTGVIGTYGQAVPDVQPQRLQNELYLTGIAANDGFRTNVGLVNRGSVPMTATLTLYSRTGAVLSMKDVTLAASSFQQAPLASFFPEVANTTQDALTMRIVAASSSAISGYCSVVDNKTQDPVYIQARPAETGSTLTIPVVGRSPGANGTFWRSDLTIFNTSPNAITATLRYNGATRNVFIGGNDTAVVDDVLSEFGLTSSSGALQVSWSSSTGPVVTSRTYTTVESGGTYGQSIDPVESFGSKVFVPGLRNDASYRSNAGFVNGGNETEFFTVVMLSPSGTELARNTLTLTAGQQTQTSVGALFPNITAPNGFTLQVEGDTNAKLFAYGSMVDNKSGDPVFFAGR